MKTLALAAILLTAGSPSSKPKDSSGDLQRNSRDCPQPSITRVDNSSHSTEANCSQQKPPEAKAPIEWANWALVVVGAITAFAVWLQAKETKKATQAMRDGIPLQRQAACAASKSANVAQNNTSALVKIERAWLVAEVSAPSTFSQPFGNNGAIIQGFGFKWTIKNCGKTPGFVTKIGARFHIAKTLSELPLEPNIDWPGVQPTESFAVGIPLAPGETLQRCRMLEDSGRYPSNEEMKLIEDGAIHCLGYGVIEYKTVVDETIYKTWFCHRWLPNQDFDAFPVSPVPANYTQYT